MVNHKLEFYFKIRPTTISKDFDCAYLLISLVALFWENLGQPETNWKSSQDNKIDDLL